MSCQALKRRRRFHASGDRLESRIILSGATVFVTSPADAGTGTLRAAIIAANANPGTTIDFRLQLVPATINLASPLPQIIEPTTIDGTSQPGYTGTPLVTVDGSGLAVAPAGGFDFEPGSGGSVIEGLEITGFAIAAVTVNNAANITIGGSTAGQGNVISGNPGEGVALNGEKTSGVLVEGNEIGTNASGTDAVANGIGVSIAGATANTIGGTVAVARNVISGNTTDGVEITSAGGAAAATLNVVEGNLIGTNAAGKAALSNRGDGVGIDGNATNNTIGGGLASDLNVISGNLAAGVAISGPDASGNTVAGNEIGTDRSATVALANGIGVSIVGATGNTIGGIVSAAGNVISGNTTDGVAISASPNAVVASLNVVEGNLIGTNAGGTAALANVENGVVINAGATNNTIGGTVTGDRNVISGNDGAGVAFAGGSDNTIAGNYIGTNAAGNGALGNGDDGIRFDDGTNNTIGGTLTGSFNLISGNSNDGIYVHGSVGTEIAGNQIGTDASGQTAIGNGTGIFLDNGTSTSIGGTSAGAGNVISGNVNAGIEVLGNLITDTQIVGNRIGTNSAGTAAVVPTGQSGPPQGLQDTGIAIIDAPGNTIGGTGTGDRNVISGNLGYGVLLSGSFGNTVVGNYIGTDAAGNGTVANGTGVEINGGATSNTIGGTVAAGLNLISGNTTAGVAIAGAGTSANVVAGNFVGTDASGQSAVANGIGVLASGGAATTIGGTSSGAGNVISGNLTAGIELNGAAVSETQIVGNQIGTNPAGTAAVVQPGQSNPLQALQNAGVVVIGSPGNLIGGDAVGTSNLISGNYVGVMLATIPGQGNPNLVLGNLIGTDISGEKSVGNIVGIYINGAAGSQIGGTGSGAGNIVSGNTSVGVEIYGSASSGNSIEGNTIGLAADGRGVFRNSHGLFTQRYGIFILNASANMIGGTAGGAGNVISGNESAGVFIQSLAGNASGNTVDGNFIGLGPGGSAGPGNNGYGIVLFNAPNNTIGRAGPAANHFGRNGIADIRLFTGPVPGSRLLTVASRSRRRESTHPAGPARHLRLAAVPARTGRIPKTDHGR